jgi:type IV pilus assembly protein PilX
MQKQHKNNKQRGAVMITVLILSMVLTVAVISQMNITLLDEKIVANQKNRHIAFQAAEGAIREAEIWLEEQAEVPSPLEDGAGSIWSLGSPKQDDADAAEWWMANANDNEWWQGNGLEALTQVDDLPNINDEEYRPRYIMEYYAYVQDSLVTGQQKDEQGRNFYRITTRGFGGSDSARVTLQTTYSRR